MPRVVCVVFLTFAALGVVFIVILVVCAIDGFSMWKRWRKLSVAIKELDATVLSTREQAKHGEQALGSDIARIGQVPSGPRSQGECPYKSRD